MTTLDLVLIIYFFFIRKLHGIELIHISNVRGYKAIFVGRFLQKVFSFGA